ncbi:MAG: Fe-S protein assembly co-chaperone HscB [Deltaproteobacteria bacterium]|jgi:molecular chaperone HscB|nr:Fe-S protein assembly co-chaperone HscB [Deltaproteobacteria bacterium]
MICWSCQKAAGEGVLCAACGAVQPPDSKADYFQVFGIPEVYALDEAGLEQRYKELTKLLHPDRFARADPRARRASLERSVQLNEAWRTLKDPIRRAEYMLLLAGIDIGEMAGTGRQPADHVTLPVPPVLLMEVMELREALAAAHAAKDVHETEALIAKVQSRLKTVVEDVAKGFAASPPELSFVAARLVGVRYYRRFLDEARLLWEQEGAGPGKDHSHAG